MNHTLRQKRVLQDYVNRQVKLNPQGNSPAMQLLLDYAKGLAGFAAAAIAAGFVCLLGGVAYMGGLPIMGVVVLVISLLVLVGVGLWNMADLFAERNEP